MEPFVVDRITNPNGGVVTRTKPRKLRRAVSRQTAQELTQMMEGAVQSGTGTAAQIPGVAVAGKTGTAETRHPGPLHVLVHQLRAGERAASRRGRRAAGPDRLRRPGRGPDREGRHAGNPGRKGEPLT
jgi:cell division protein FtsI/penicillin-binding protein 2